MIQDHTHVLTKQGDIFTVRGFCSEGAIWAVPIYFVSNNGDKIFGSKKYTKLVDEFGEKYQNLIPEWLVETSFGIRIKIPIFEVVQLFDPFSNFQQIYKQLDAPIYKNVIDALSQIVPFKDIGHIGSYLIGFPSSRSDLDLVIRGKNNMLSVKNRFDDFLKKIKAQCSITQKQFDKSIRKYNTLFNKDNNDFDYMIYNRWPTVYIPNKLFCKIRFTYNAAEDDIFQPPKLQETKEATISGEVIEDTGVSFMPRHFILRDVQNRDYTVVTYFWDYSYCVSKKDIVSVAGAVDKSLSVIVIRDRRRHGIRFKKLRCFHCPII